MPTKQNKKKSHKAHDQADKHHAHSGKGHHDQDDSEEVIEATAEAVDSDETDSDLTDSEQSNSRNEESIQAGGKDAEESQGAHASEKNTDESYAHNGSRTEDADSDEVKLDFPYSGLVRAYAPKAMDVAEKVATDWKKDGSFMNLGIDNPYANMAVSMGLKKAKELEKKLDEKGVLSVVRMGVEVIKQQVNKKK